ncbi:N-carbamoylsarcosine amidohydrolase [Nocardioides sp. AN3]
MTVAPWDTEVAARYRAGGLGGTLTPRGRFAIVVVDLQNGFTDPECGPGFELSDEVAATRMLLERARAVGVPAYFSAISFAADELDCVWLEKMPVMRELTAGSRWEQIDARLGGVDPERVVVKQTASAFAGTDLATRLRAEQVGTVIVVGATTSGCVRATAVDACAHDLVTYVVREAVGDRETGPHEAALLDLDAKYADVIDLETALDLLGAPS